MQAGKVEVLESQYCTPHSFYFWSPAVAARERRRLCFV